MDFINISYLAAATRSHVVRSVHRIILWSRGSWSLHIARLVASPSAFLIFRALLISRVWSSLCILRASRPLSLVKGATQHIVGRCALRSLSYAFTGTLVVDYDYIAASFFFLMSRHVGLLVFLLC